jgi:hypothetical protein
VKRAGRRGSIVGYYRVVYDGVLVCWDGACTMWSI